MQRSSSNKTSLKVRLSTLWCQRKSWRCARNTNPTGKTLEQICVVYRKQSGRTKPRLIQTVLHLPMTVTFFHHQPTHPWATHDGMDLLPNDLWGKMLKQDWQEDTSQKSYTRCNQSTKPFPLRYSETTSTKKSALTGIETTGWTRISPGINEPFTFNN